MRALPTGAVTFLFSDIEGSTRLLQKLGDGYAEVLAEHQRLLRQAWAEHEGIEIDTQGDSFFVVFARATAALAAAAQAQHALATHPWPEGGQVRVRMGLHTGTGTLSHGHYVGLDVHRAARIAAAGHGGQVLLSQATHDQVAKELVAGAGLRDLGKHRLKDLPRREELYQLVLPGLPADYPPLQTLDAWPGLRADLSVVAGLTLAVLTVVGLLLSALVPAFPRGIGLGAAAATVLVLATSGVAQPVRRVLVSQWRDARKPFAAITSGLLSLVVVTTTLFITKPPIFIGVQHLGYDFGYTYHAPTHRGDSVTVGVAGHIETLAPNGLGQGALDNLSSPIWQGCVVQLPDLTLGIDGWKPDQCTEVPTVDNGGESPDGKTTIFHIDPKAVWSDGVPISADDFLFGEQLAADPNTYGGAPFNQMTLTALDSHTVQIRWADSYADYLTALLSITPLPLHVYATGSFAGIYNPVSGSYNSALAQQLRATPAFNTSIPVDNGAFTVQSFAPDSQVVLVKNQRFFSNFFHTPALDHITLWDALQDFPAQLAAGLPPGPRLGSDLIGRYQRGELELALGFDPLAFSQLGGIPKREVITSSTANFARLAFNQRSAAPNASANGGVSFFTEHTVRQAFVEAVDRCAAVRAVLGTITCGDANLFTDETEATASDATYDPTFRLPLYNPADAAHLMDQAGYRIVDGIRRGKDGITPLAIKLYVSPGFSAGEALAQRLQADYLRNLHMEVTVVNDLTLWTPQSNPVLSGTFDLLIADDQSTADPVGRLTNDLGPFDAADVLSPQNPGEWNPFGILDPYVIQRDQLGAQTLSDEQRKVVLRSLERYFSQQYYVEEMFIRADVTLTKPTLCNFKHWPQNGFDLWNLADWYVAPSCP
jgi:class 3 adenylate cyclase/ABC-type transport system substrate-binding protein